jgi:methionyl-tRNA synthetase
LVKYDRAMERLEYPTALEIVLELVRQANKYIEIFAPWELAKQQETQSQLATVLYQLVEVIRFSILLFEPFMPTIREKVWRQLGLEQVDDEQARKPQWGYCFHKVQIDRGQPLFPRLDLNEILNRAAD